MPDPIDPLEAAIREFCYGHGRAVPRSVFLGRVVARGEPQWLPEDTEAALEWQIYQNSLCSGCRRPRDESFDIGMDDHYTVTVLQCHACAARERKAYDVAASVDRGSRPPAGQFFIVTPEESDADLPVVQSVRRRDGEDGQGTGERAEAQDHA